MQFYRKKIKIKKNIGLKTERKIYGKKVYLLISLIKIKVTKIICWKICPLKQIVKKRKLTILFFIKIKI